MTKLWGGRFEKPTDELMERFNASIGFDVRLYRADIAGSIAYARALERAGLLTPEECQTIVAGLEQVRAEFDQGRFVVQPGDEDIHTAVERRLHELIGPLAGKLHTGRSRNDQVATDTRLYLLWEIDRLQESLTDLQQAIVEKAEEGLGEPGHEVIMPGYTHLQPAQPVLFSHWLLSYFWMFRRDGERLAGLRERVATLPLGSGALAGNPFGVDREFLARELGFARLAENSMDAVSDRDFITEFLAWAALLQMHLSRLAEDLILFSSPGYGFVTIDEAYATGSSLMPQKRNPDSLELVRGKTGRVYGHLMGLLTTMKGLPSTYNKDLQEDKEPLFDVVDTLAMELPIMAGVVRTLVIHPQRMAAALDDSLLATDLADELVRQGVPFREAHRLVGQVVRRAGELGVSLCDLPLAEYRTISEHFGPSLYQALDFQRSVERRSGRGGTAPQAVREQIKRAKLAQMGQL